METSTIIILVGNLVAWFGGRPTALMADFVSEKFKGYISHGLLPKKIKVTRQPNEGDKFVLNYNNVPLFNSSTKKYSYYNVTVKVKVKEKVLLGEAEFGMFGESKLAKLFEFAVTSEEGAKIEKTNPVHEQVLDILKVIIKVSVTPQLTPNQSVEAIAVTRGGLGVLDFFNRVFRRLVAVQEIDITSSQREHLESKNYVAGLVEAAKHAAQKYGDLSILENYFRVKRCSLEKELITVNSELEASQKEVKEREEEQRSKRLRSKVVRGIIIAVAVLLAAGLITLIILAPPIGATVASGFLGIVSTIVGFLGSKIFTSLETIGLATLSVGMFTKFSKDYKETRLEKAQDRMRKAEVKKQEITTALQQVKEEEKGAKNALLEFANIKEDKVKEYVDSVCYRNLALECAKNEDTEGFFENYRKIDKSYQRSVFLDVDKEDKQLILETVKKDIGTYESKFLGLGGCGVKLTCLKLKSLDTDSRTALLEICFTPKDSHSVSADAASKAILISNMLDILFKHGYNENFTQPVFRDIACIIYDVMNNPSRTKQKLLDECVNKISSGFSATTVLPLTVSASLLKDIQTLLQEKEDIYISKAEPTPTLQTKPTIPEPKPVQHLPKMQKK